MKGIITKMKIYEDENGYILFPEDVFFLEDFKDWFVSSMLHCKTLDELADKIGYIITDEAFTETIVALTEWDREIIEDANAKTLCFWLLLYLLYTDYEKGYWTDDIYSWLDSQVLK